MDMSDSEILNLSYQKPSVFGQLFDRYHKGFLRKAISSLAQKERAEDAVQETFVRIYKYGQKFLQSGGDFRAWSYKILHHAIVDEARKYSLELPLGEETENTLGHSEMQEESESANYVDSVFAKMDSAAREVLRFRFVLGKSFKEIARLFGITSSAARVRAFRAKKEFLEIHKKLNTYGK